MWRLSDGCRGLNSRLIAESPLSPNSPKNGLGTNFAALKLTPLSCGNLGLNC